MLTKTPSLADQIYHAVIDEVCDGRLAPGTHIVQEQLAARFGVSRQPVQQAMALLRADGVVEEIGRRGLCVARLDAERMRQHYGVRAALDAWAARSAAQAAANGTLDPGFEARADAVLAAGNAAVASGDVAAQVRRDDDFHALVYAASGNPMIATTAEPHWRFLRRAMGDVLRQPQTPREIWREHAEIVAAILDGEASLAERRATAHVERAATLLTAALAERTAREALA